LENDSLHAAARPVVKRIALFSFPLLFQISSSEITAALDHQIEENEKEKEKK